MRMALWCMLGIQLLTTPGIKCRRTENSEEDLSSTRGWSLQAWKWVHTVLYPNPKARDIADHFWHRWDASLERHDEKKGCWTEEKRKLVFKWQIKLISLALYSAPHYSLVDPTLIIINLHFLHINNSTYPINFTLCCMFNHWKLLCLLVCNTKSKNCIFYNIINEDFLSFPFSLYLSTNWHSR